MTGHELARSIVYVCTTAFMSCEINVGTEQQHPTMRRYAVQSIESLKSEIYFIFNIESAKSKTFRRGSRAHPSKPVFSQAAHDMCTRKVTCVTPAKPRVLPLRVAVGRKAYRARAVKSVPLSLSPS